MTEQELLQVPEHLRELFREYDALGWNPQLCDVPVPYYDNRVPCGMPLETGDICDDEYALMPRDMAMLDMTFAINAYGDSMVGAGIDHGDRLEVLATPVARHGDIVVACLDEGKTVKGFFVDDYGRQWLVPANDKYKPILITEERKVRIEGRVVSVRKLAPRGDNRAMRNAVLGSEEYAAVKVYPKEIRAKHAIRKVAPMVKNGRQWYAVYRALVDVRVVDDGDYPTFVQQVYMLVPDHSQLPQVGELRRMEVQSFRRCVELWDADDAPVSGSRFDAYLQIARATLEEFSKKLP